MLKMADCTIGFESRERVCILLILRQLGNRPPAQLHVFPGVAEGGYGGLTRLEDSKNGRNTGFITMTDLLKFVEGQDDVKKMCKTLRESGDHIPGFSVEDKKQLQKGLMGRFKAKSITPPGKGVRNYGEVGQKVVEGE